MLNKLSYLILFMISLVCFLSQGIALANAVPDFNQYKDVKQKKKAFFDYIRPSAIKMNKKIKQQRQLIDQLYAVYQREHRFTTKQKQAFMAIADRYHLDLELSVDKLYRQLKHRVDVIPTRLVLVQAANESAWGTSRFARKGKNFFGIWCYKKGCGIVPKKRGEGEVHEVAVFDSVDKSVETYFYNLNTHGFYKDLRDLRFKLRTNDEKVTAHKMAKALINYSTRRQAYVDELRAMLRHNEAYFGIPESVTTELYNVSQTGQ